VQASINIQNDIIMARVMSRSYYGKWYVPPEGWSKLERKALEDQKVDGVPVTLPKDEEAEV